MIRLAASTKVMTFVATIAGGVAGLFALLPGAAVVALPACEIPSKTCFGERVSALVTDAGDPEPTCTTCVQASCCDAVGACHDDPKCLESFRTAHSCVIDNGPGEESRCTTNLTPTARTLYACMRTSCGGATCRVPSCDVDRSASLIVNASCDRCVGGACCEKLNVCYGDRRCKLIIECVIDKCRLGIGVTMDQLGLLDQTVRDRARTDVCSGRDPPIGPDDCLKTCINDFAPQGEGATADDQGARCRAFEVIACGAEGACGAKCAVSSATADAGTGVSSKGDGG